MFADDTNLMVVARVFRRIFTPCGWSKLWRLGFNVKKFVHLCFSKNQEDIHPYHVEGFAT